MQKLFMAALIALVSGGAYAQERGKVRAEYLVTVADDFVVNVYHNGKFVPEAKRKILLERFGATVERMDVQVREGDWLVFNVVNNRLRWGGPSSRQPLLSCHLRTDRSGSRSTPSQVREEAWRTIFALCGRHNIFNQPEGLPASSRAARPLGFVEMGARR